MKASNSNSNISRPSSSKSKTSSLKMRSRSKPREREYMLWIPEPLENLENVIQSKQRTLDLLNYQTETLDKEVQEQLLSRDRYISELNRTILDLRSELKSKDSGIGANRNWEKELEGQERAFLDTKSENKEIEKKIRDLEADFEAAIRQWDEEKENLIIVKNALGEEGEELKTALDERNSELVKLVSSNKVLQSANQRLTNLNAELLSNVDKVNVEIQGISSKYYEANRSAVRAKELQKTLDEYLTINSELESKNSKALKYADSLSRFMKLTEWVGKNLQNIEEHAKIREDSLNKATEDTFANEISELKDFLADTMMNLETIRSSVANNTPVIDPQDKLSEEILRNRITEIENEVKNLRLIYEELKNREITYIDQISDLNNSIQHQSIEYHNQVIKIKNQIELMKNAIDAFNHQVENFKAENEKNQAELYKTKSKLTHLAGKDEFYQIKRKEFKETEENLKLENLELKNKVQAINRENRGTFKASASEDLKVKKSMSQLQILRDELFRKDTDLVKKAREMIKLEQEMEKHRNNNQKLHAKMKSIEAEVISKVSQDLEEKDREIEILKEMLKCAHADIKVKDSQIISMKHSERMTSPKRK